MKRSVIGCLIGLLFAGATSPPDALAQNLVTRLPDRLELERFDLQRAWYTKIPMLAREQTTSLMHYQDVLFAQTNQGMIHCLDAATGKVRWSVKVAPLDRTVYRPSVVNNFVYVTTGDTLYQLSKESGRVYWTRQLPSPIVASPAATDEHVFVNCANNNIYAISLNDDYERRFTKRPVDWFYNAGGPLTNPPVVVDEWVSFAASNGTLYTSSVNERQLFYRFLAYSSIPAPVTSLGTTLFIATGDFNIFAVESRTGQVKWRFRTGYPIETEPMPFVRELFTVPVGMGLYCLNIADGSEKWLNQQANRLIAVSQSHVYGADRLNNFLILSRETGRLVGSIPMSDFEFSAYNRHTDRIYISSQDGVVVCLHETQNEEPFKHPQVVDEEKPEKESYEPLSQPKRNFFGEIIEDEPRPDRPAMESEPKEKKPARKNFFFDE